jgi:hypothetical protein
MFVQLPISTSGAFIFQVAEVRISPIEIQVCELEEKATKDDGVGAVCDREIAGDGVGVDAQSKAFEAEAEFIHCEFGRFTVHCGGADDRSVNLSHEHGVSDHDIRPGVD